MVATELVVAPLRDQACPSPRPSPSHARESEAVVYARESAAVRLQLGGIPVVQSVMREELHALEKSERALIEAALHEHQDRWDLGQQEAEWRAALYVRLLRQDEAGQRLALEAAMVRDHNAAVLALHEAAYREAVAGAWGREAARYRCAMREDAVRARLVEAWAAPWPRLEAAGRLLHCEAAEERWRAVHECECDAHLVGLRSPAAAAELERAVATLGLVEATARAFVAEWEARLWATLVSTFVTGAWLIVRRTLTEEEELEWAGLCAARAFMQEALVGPVAPSGTRVPRAATAAKSSGRGRKASETPPHHSALDPWQRFGPYLLPYDVGFKKKAQMDPRSRSRTPSLSRTPKYVPSGCRPHRHPLPILPLQCRPVPPSGLPPHALRGTSVHALPTGATGMLWPGVVGSDLVTCRDAPWGVGVLIRRSNSGMVVGHRAMGAHQGGKERPAPPPSPSALGRTGKIWRLQALAGAYRGRGI